MKATLLAAAAVAVGSGVFHLRRRIFVATVRGTSMEPGLHDGDRLVVHRVRISTVRCGDVVVVECPDADTTWHRPPSRRTDRDFLVKRVAAVPGDRTPPEVVPAVRGTGTDVVPPSRLVVLGDNAKHSFDSRTIGYIPAERLAGVVVRRLGDRGPHTRPAASPGRRTAPGTVGLPHLLGDRRRHCDDANDVVGRP